ncbi:GNAT family N-acetyltransferase [Paenibacillus wenxiniae]|uniref:GNAT family N-acetyltransferase n=1 Tax=Paenibacillus wenxiniae TaxID=1636843 RepID=A0ABW4RP38_9BACL
MTEPPSSRSIFTDQVYDYWQPSSDCPSSGTYRVIIDAKLPVTRSVMLLDPLGCGGFLSLVPAIAQRAGLEADSEIAASTLFEKLRLAGVELNGADYLFYVPLAEQKLLLVENFPATVRQLTPKDAAVFEAFVLTAPEVDLDEAFVELDHWLVFGYFVDERLVSVASMYVWNGTSFADLGIITLPQFRGRGFGRQTVRAIVAQALKQGLESQYRCQPDNISSARLAEASGFSLFAKWDVIKLDED